MENFKIPVLKDEKDAKKKAKECLVKLFDDKMLTIDNIKSLISDFHKVANQTSIEVFNKIEHNITELDTSLKSIDQIILNMKEANVKQKKFFQSWTKITSPLNEYGADLEKLMIGKKNVSLMYNNLSMYVKVQDEIKELRRLLEEDKYTNLTTVFKKIRYFEYIRIALIQKLKKETRSNKLNNLADHLMCVQEFSNEFFEEFWGYFRDAPIICKDRPEFLVKCLRLIEEDKNYLISIRKIFKTYNKPESKFRGIIDSQRSNNKNNNLETSEIRESHIYDEEDASLPNILLDKLPIMIKESFDEKFKNKVERDDVLNESLNMVKELHHIYLKVVPCFPPHYDIFNTVYKKCYLENIQLKLKPFLNEEELSNTPGLLIPIAHWLTEFGSGLRNVGIDINETELANVITYYMHYFYDHINEVLDSNLNVVLQKNREDKNKLKTQKKIDLSNIHSYYATDVYSSIINVIDLLSGDFQDMLLFQIIKQICEKIELLIKTSDEELKNLNKPEELIIACVYVSDSSNCLEIFPKFKKKIKSLLPKDLYKHIKLRFISSTPSILSMYNQNLRTGCNKVIELMFKDLESSYLNKMFTAEWNDDILEGIFGTFGEYFNKGFVKILKSQNNLLILVRSFIDCFVWYYIEEIIHSVRSLQRKILVTCKDSALVKYQFKYLTMNDDELVYKEKKKKNKKKSYEDFEILGAAELADIKDLNNNDEQQKKKFEKYPFPVKKFKDSDKEYDCLKVIDRIGKDKEIFSDFLFGFSDETTHPFSVHFSETLGSNYIQNFENKFDVVLNVLKCHFSALKENITHFKEYYNGNDGKSFLEALLYVRQDTENVTKPDMKLYLLDCFNVK